MATCSRTATLGLALAALAAAACSSGDARSTNGLSGLPARSDARPEQTPWSMSAYCGSVQFLNLPNYVAYRPEQLLVPADAL